MTPAPVPGLAGGVDKAGTVRPVPPITALDLAFGKTDHMPRYEDVPAEFKGFSINPYCDFVSGWFLNGLKQEDLALLVPKEGVDKGAALAAIKAILGSFQPKHEHKEAACAFLLSEWFTLSPTAPA